mmetsp:Transcript_73771/g.240297  ORF Transcript_73771/g.240297 Transcript_73771/m.240297 type:complete len:207 (-) Transcript_73771:977-1597(-)
MGDQQTLLALVHRLRWTRGSGGGGSRRRHCRRGAVSSRRPEGRWARRGRGRRGRARLLREVLQMFLQACQGRVMHGQRNILTPPGITVIDLLEKKIPLLLFLERLDFGLAQAMGLRRGLPPLRRRQCRGPNIGGSGTGSAAGAGAGAAAGAAATAKRLSSADEERHVGLAAHSLQQGRALLVNHRDPSLEAARLSDQDALPLGVGA